RWRGPLLWAAPTPCALVRLQHAPIGVSVERSAASSPRGPGQEAMENKATVREATPADVPAIAAIYRPAVLDATASFELELPDEAERARRFNSIRTGNYPYFVAEADGQVVGYAYANAYRARPAYRFSVENSIYIAPEAQGRGIGRLLLRRLIEACTTLG